MANLLNASEETQRESFSSLDAAEEALLVRYASGNLEPAPSLLVATHLALRPDRRSYIGDLEAIGGALLDALPAEEVSDGVREAVFNRLDEEEGFPQFPRVNPRGNDLMTAIPRPLRDYLGSDLNNLPWRGMGRGASFVRLPVDSAHSTYLLRVEGGVAMPHHGHRGLEITLVLNGGYTDESGHFVRGDIEIADHDTEHRPVADEGTVCLCLSVSDGPIRLTSAFGRLINPFLR